MSWEALGSRLKLIGQQRWYQGSWVAWSCIGSCKSLRPNLHFRRVLETLFLSDPAFKSKVDILCFKGVDCWACCPVKPSNKKYIYIYPRIQRSWLSRYWRCSWRDHHSDGDLPLLVFIVEEVVSSWRILIIIAVIIVEGCWTAGLDTSLEILDKLEIDSQGSFLQSDSLHAELSS